MAEGFKIVQPFFRDPITYALSVYANVTAMLPLHGKTHQVTFLVKWSYHLEMVYDKDIQLLI